MARNEKKIVWMEHEFHGVMPVYDGSTVAQNESNGWKRCEGPLGSAALQKREKAATAKELAEEEAAASGDASASNALA